MELGIPMVIALNMMDEVEKNGGTIRVNELEAELGIPVVPISAAKNQGVDELVDHALHVARFYELPEQIDFCPSSEPIRSSTSLHPRNCSSHRALRRAGFRAPQIRRNQNG